MKKISEGLGYITTQERKNGNYYTGWISYGYDENGNQIRKSKSSYSLKEIKSWIKKRSLEIYSEDADAPLLQVVLNYVNTIKKPTIEPRTYDQYISRIENHLKGYPLADMTFNQIERPQVQSYIDTLIADKSIPTAEFMLMLIKSVYNRKRDENKINYNPATFITIPKRTKKTRRPLTHKEQELILKELNLEDKRDLAIFLSLCIGSRLGEILALKWEDIDENGLVTINKQFARNGSNFDEIKPTKTEQSNRVTALPPFGRLTMEHYRSQGFIFTDDGQRPMDRKRIQRRYKQICEKHGIDSTFHCTRHTFATNMIEAGVDAFTLREMLGHTELETTMVYVHITEEMKKLNSAKINDKIMIPLSKVK